jgi:hypothetical protein
MSLLLLLLLKIVSTLFDVIIKPSVVPHSFSSMIVRQSHYVISPVCSVELVCFTDAAHWKFILAEIMHADNSVLSY